MVFLGNAVQVLLGDTVCRLVVGVDDENQMCTNNGQPAYSAEDSDAAVAVVLWSVLFIICDGW